jgi:hypothetical protein
VLGPDGADFGIRGEFAAPGGLFRGGDRCSFIVRKHYRRSIVRASKLEHNAGDIILRIRRQLARSLQCLF